MVMEFFASGDEVWYQDQDGMSPLCEGSPVIPYLIDMIRDTYPKAYKALCSCYAKSARNHGYYRFLIARRFCKCNFGTLDNTRKDVGGDFFHLERVPCPLMGECPYEGVICMPEVDSRLSEAEKRVMCLVCEGRSNAEIANELYLSPNTVKRHISTSYYKTKSGNRAAFVKYAKENQLF